MVLIRTLTLLLGALAVMTLGALPAPSSASAMPPCHETSSGHHPPADRPAPEKPMKPMGCCVACVATVVPGPPVRADVFLPTPPRNLIAALLPVGEILSPDPHPPR